MTTPIIIECVSSTYSDDEFELSVSPTVSQSEQLPVSIPVAPVQSTTLDTQLYSTAKENERDIEGSMQKADKSPDEDGREVGLPTADEMSVSHEYQSEFEAANETPSPSSPASPFAGCGETLPFAIEALVPPVSSLEGRRTAKQEYLDLKRKVAVVHEEADVLAQRRHVEELRIRLQAQETKESWHYRIHRRQTEAEWHVKVAEKIAESVISTSLHREAWICGISRARANAVEMDKAYKDAFASLKSRCNEREELAAADSTAKAIRAGAACENVWDASKRGVPVRRLCELMEHKMERTRHTNPSEPFEQLCRRVEGIVVESKHPYTKGVRQELEACVPGAERFYLVFDAASNTTAGAGKVALLRHNDRDPVVFAARGAYTNNAIVSSDEETRLPGVDGEPPMRVDGSSVLITFSASYWRGVAAAGEDYGWRLVCFATHASANESQENDNDNGVGSGEGRDVDSAITVTAEAEKAADRAEAVDAINALGESCLHVACFEGNVAAARYLLSLDADPNSAHTAGGLNTPLHEAVRGGSLAATRLLLKSSANVLAANAHGDLPLHLACRAGRLDIARRLLAHDADCSTVAAVNRSGQRPSDVVRNCAALVSLFQIVDRAAATAKANRSSLLARNKENAPGKHRALAQGKSTSTSKNIGGGSTMGGRMAAKRKGRGVSGARGQHHALPRWARFPRPMAADGVVLDEVESVGGSLGSGTSYAASLTESDFQIPLPTEGAVDSNTGARKDR